MDEPIQYVYFFTRQDISREQQLVQTAHVAYALGAHAIHPEKADLAHGTYFTVVGVRNLEALNGAQNILKAFRRKHVVFHEPDLNNEMTSIATYPIPADQRNELLAFNLLRF